MNIWVMRGGSAPNPTRKVWVRMSTCEGLYKEEESADDMVGFVYTDSEAARLLAGLEIALDKALQQAGRGKCLRCGSVWCHQDASLDVRIRCSCGGVLEPTVSP